jgi:hypothetical protein
MTKKNKRNRYTDGQRTAVLAALEGNGGNVQRTECDLKIFDDPGVQPVSRRHGDLLIVRRIKDPRTVADKSSRASPATRIQPPVASFQPVCYHLPLRG